MKRTVYLMAGNGLSQTVEAKPEPKVEAKSTKHPLDPLTEDEIKLASKTLKDDKKATKKAIYASISLSEPKKADVLVYKLGDPFERRAKVVFYESDTNETIEAIVNLGTKVVESRTIQGTSGIASSQSNQSRHRVGRAAAAQLQKPYTEKKRIASRAAQPNERTTSERAGRNVHPPVSCAVSGSCPCKCFQLTRRGP